MEPKNELTNIHINTEIEASALISPELNQKKQCENCYSPVEGPFCAQCGQEVESTLKYFWTVLLHVLNDIFSFDSRANRTLFPLLFRPGFLTNQYFQGHRVHYVPPIRLYLFISIIFFISLKFSTSTGLEIEHVKEVESLTKEVDKIAAIYKQSDVENSQEKLVLLSSFNSKLAEIKQRDSINNNAYESLISELVALESKLVSGQLLSIKESEKYETLNTKWQNIQVGKAELSPERGINFSNNPDGTFTFDWLTPSANAKLEQATSSIEQKVKSSSFDQLFEQALDKFPQLMFILLPLFALILKIMYLFSKRLYLEHLTVALHSHSFIFLALLVAELLDLLTDYSAKNLPSVQPILDNLVVVILVWVPIYLFIMQKRVYKQGYFLTAVKYSFIGIIYTILLSIAFLTAFIWGVADLPS
ncbi:DUF3667 domain-containing protein [Thalassotalea marina]|uniref:DUF3667 domain-containing protein n=1 Tax=Thalassotalea marina TaxID=1673741 RepID=A0A919BFJ2_9GAMM|nr:DUF3667 domain-containing protein [Thalassotalea marina]GHF85466.1 hypothetical protein GCM10017161_11280 [Thalassotalea marina]